MAGEIQGPVLEGVLENVSQDCSIGYSVCTNTDLQWRYDQWESDVNNNHGQYVWCCGPCYDEMCDEI